MSPFNLADLFSPRIWSSSFIVMLCFHSRSRSRDFLGMIVSDSHSRIVGMFFFISFPFPNFGNRFFHSLPIPEFWECFFPSLPVPELGEWFFSIPFPFSNFGNGIIHSHSRSRSRTPKCHSRSALDVKEHIFISVMIYFYFYIDRLFWQDFPNLCVYFIRKLFCFQFWKGECHL